MSVQQTFIAQLKEVLATLVDDGAIRRFYNGPVSVSESPEYPYVYFRLAEDVVYEGRGLPQKLFKGIHQVHVVIVCDQQDDFVAGMLAARINDVREKIQVSRNSFPGITITEMRLLGSPVVGDQIDFGAAIISILYTGIDSY